MQTSIKNRIDKLHAKVVIEKPDENPEETRKKWLELSADIRRTFEVTYQASRNQSPVEQERRLRELWNALAHRFRKIGMMLDELPDIAELGRDMEEAVRYWMAFLNQPNKDGA